MMRWVLRCLAVALLPVGGATAQAPQIPTIAIHLDNFAFSPDRIQLRNDMPVRLHLVNDSSGSHNFSASELFATSTFPAGDRPAQGTIDVAGNSTADVEFIPRTPGIYPFDCTHFLHHMFGMHGTIVVLAR